MHPIQFFRHKKSNQMLFLLHSWMLQLIITHLLPAGFSRFDLENTEICISCITFKPLYCCMYWRCTVNLKVAKILCRRFWQNPWKSHDLFILICRIYVFVLVRLAVDTSETSCFRNMCIWLIYYFNFRCSLLIILCVLSPNCVSKVQDFWKTCFAC